MSTLRELYIKRKNQVYNHNGTEGLINRIEKLKNLSGEEKIRFAEKIKGYVEALSDNQIITFQDAKDWEWIIESNVKGLH